VRFFPIGALPFFLVSLFLIPALPVPCAIADERPMVAQAEKKDLPIEVEVSGMFQAEDKERIALEPDEYSGELIIKAIIAEGVTVKKGDQLLDFEVDNLKKAITKAENEVDDARVKLQKAQAELETLKIDQSVTMHRVDKELELAENAVAAEQQMVDYNKLAKETEIRRKENSIRDQKVNFDQLKKLYDSRELHTDTETILVEREAKQLEEAAHDLKKMVRNYEHFKKYELIVDLENKKLERLKKEAEKKKEKLKFGADLAEKESGVRKAQREVDETTEKVTSLNKDLGNLKVLSPRDGIVFYGTLGGGDMFADVVIFSGSNVRQNLRIGGRVKTHETLLTVASMEKLSVEMKVLENDIQHMKEGLSISLRPDAFPDLELKGKIDKVDQIAKRGGYFSSVQEFKVKASYDGTHPQLRAGMNCRVTVHADSIPDAVQVPVIAVFEEGGRYFCYADENGKPAKRPVTLGATNGKAVQIVEGLRAGEKVYLYDPFRE
jgi:HlyD family secretion protein